MAENQNKCTGNCMACTIIQRQYCASQLAYTNMKMLEQMQQIVIDIKEKIEAAQNNEALLFDPMSDDSGIPSGIPTSPIAQSGDGA